MQTALDSDFAGDLLRALAQPRKSISPKYFYDSVGSQLFDRICELPEYYPTRTEVALLRQVAPEIAILAGPHAELIEFGAGSLTKVRLLLQALQAPRRYLPVDISGDHLQASAQRLGEDFSGLEIVPIVADYTQSLNLPAVADAYGHRIGFFPGSTIGNFTLQEAQDFLCRCATLLRGGALLLGADLVKHPDTLHAAYNDTQGVTAAFNLNLLVRANRELGTDFVVSQFTHSAFYNAPLQRIEMHLVSKCRQDVRLGEACFRFEEGETLHTENSYKFTIDGVRALAQQAGFTPGTVWTDPNKLFSLHWLIAPT
jgi:dimethylhistidine N-methyltransferase